VTTTDADAATALGEEDSAAEAALRAEVRAWMEEHAARFGPAFRGARMADNDDEVVASRAWLAELDDGGWAVPSWPEAFGGRAFGTNEMRIVKEEEHRYATPDNLSTVGLQMVAPTLMVHGSPEQQAKFLDPMRRGQHIWCQLFSEPDAGSDLASLRTKAERDGDDWIVTGQKVWTSGAQYSDWAILLARTEQGSFRHRGITYFLLDMKTPGIDVRPLVQINRAAHFNEVHLDGVRLPADAVVGEVGEGWTVARTTLGSERAMIGSMNALDRFRPVIERARKSGRTEDPVLRDQLVQTWILASVLGYTGDRVLEAVRKGGQVGPEASVLKLAVSTLMGRFGEMSMSVLGPEGMLEGLEPTDDRGYGPLQDMFLSQWSSRIGGGTEQIQRNLIAERALGLPRDPKPQQPT
jgi:alkylation response protein AidB-like acyl-CoA dehydrogenase